jgi:UDP-2,3-diacylglucosamine pyrophosphatase LpxH
VYVLVSDLHLTTRPRSLAEGDASRAFVDFVGALTEQVQPGTTVHLVVLGDMLDLTQLVLDLDAEEALASSIDRFGRLAAIHGDLFDALGRFVSVGGRLHVCPGNHDLDLAHPGLQEQFRARLRKGQEAAPGLPGVAFHPWFLHVPDLLYAEHGHRYHDINAVRVPDGTTVAGVHAPDRTPLVAYVDGWIHAMRTGDSIGSWTYLLLERVLGPGARTGRADPGGDSLADEGGLDHDTLGAIDRLGARVGPATVARVTRVVLGPLVRPLAPYAIGLAFARLAFRNRRLRRRASVAMAVAGLLSLVRNRRVWPPPRSTAYAIEAARTLAAILERAGHRPAGIVLGHTHIPASIRLDTSQPEVCYFNTGSWMRRHEAPGAYPYVRVSRAPSGAIRSALLWWPATEK